VIVRFTLKEYQTRACQKILDTLERSRAGWREYEERTAFALSATTGSGKTVIAAAVIEALLHGSDEFEVDADPTAVILWVSKDPALNEQTRSRFVECADRIPIGDLEMLDKSFGEEALQSGVVYFINPDKLRDKSLFVRPTDSRSLTFWQILENTVSDRDKTLYLVLDEAHEGMRVPSPDEQTIVQKIINGNGDNPPVPIVWGISATVQRFDDAMGRADNRTKRPNITIDPKDVQDSGLLKNAIYLDIPDEAGDFETTMVRDATVDFVDVCERWEAYGEREGVEEPVLPLLVLQIPNKAAGERDSEKGREEEEELIHRALETVRKHWPDMPRNCVAHVLGDRATIEVGAYEIPKVAPQEIQHDPKIRVLVAKDAISTGWDCPRAEVLVSLRPGADPTYVTQLLGRMVRTPLAQSTSEDRLNSASCYLPRFDRDTATEIAEIVMGQREPATGPSGPAVAKVFLKPTILSRNDDVPDEVFTLIEGLPSAAKPTAVPRPVKRLLKASQAFGQDGLVESADKVAHQAMFDVLDAMASAHADEVETQASQILTAQVRRIRAERGKDGTTTQRLTVAADAATVDDALRLLRKLISTSVVNKYLARESQAAIDHAIEHGEEPDSVNLVSIRAHVAALGFIAATDGGPAVQQAVESAAETLVRLWLSTKAKEIAELPDSRRPTYDDILALARDPEPIKLEIKSEEQVDTVDTKGNPLARARLHLLADGDGSYPLDLNRWERAAVAHETAKGTATVGWYRNPSAAGRHSLRIAYQAGEKWRSVQPDLVIVTKDGDGELRPSIIDPHSAHQGDTSPKVKALAEYADRHGDTFDRVIFVGIEKGGALLGIDLKDSAVRRAVYECPADTSSLVALFEKHGTKYCDIAEDA
jgi:type III restriction enzyme